MTLKKISGLLLVALYSINALAQGDAKVTARIDAARITIGDQVRLFIEAQHSGRAGTLLWATIPDTFNKLEVVERGKIDTVKQGDVTTYRQRVIITGFDSGLFVIPSFQFAVINNGKPSLLRTDSFRLAVTPVAVDTTQPIKPIKGIMDVKINWIDYIWYIVGGILLIVLVVYVVLYFVKNKKIPVVPTKPKETPNDRSLRLLAALEKEQLWQKGLVKEYYVELTDIVRSYIEDRFRTPAMELTTDELLTTAMRNKELLPYRDVLGNILYTADLAKFARAQPTPAEHVNTMDAAKQFVTVTKPVIIENTAPQP
ncbi:MAG: hypothetical protein H0X33_02185 [Taibaiella sp.]|nr:hypothetical protein [Taibaiella sp.]